MKYEVEVDKVGNRFWRVNGDLHREDGPAIEYADGTKKWYLNGKRHRENSPAVELANGTKAWYLNGKRHREDGPAIEGASGGKEWYLNGKNLTEVEFNARKNSCDDKVVEIEGVKYRLTKI